MTVTFQVGDREFGGSGNLEIDFWVWPVPLSLSDIHCLFGGLGFEADTDGHTFS